MELNYFILGVCAVILLLIIVGTSVNYKSVKVLREDLDYMESESYRSFTGVTRDLERLQDNLSRSQQDTLSYIDSRIDKLNNTLNN